MKKREAKSRTDTSRSQKKGPAFSPKTGKSERSVGENNLRGIHIINDEDIEEHFGSSDGKAARKQGTEVGDSSDQKHSVSDEYSPPRAKRLTTLVKLRVDVDVWTRAVADAERRGLEISSYLDLALRRFRDGEGKTGLK